MRYIRRVLNNTQLAIVLAGLAIDSAARFLPASYARFAFLPVGPEVRVALSRSAMDRIVRRQASGGTYRNQAPVESIDLRVLDPGKPVVRDSHRVRFLPDAMVIGSGSLLWSTSIVRADVRVEDGEAVVRARQLPEGLALLLAAAIVFMLGARLRLDGTWTLFAGIGFGGIGLVSGFAMLPRKGRLALDAAVQELTARAGAADSEDADPAAPPR
jgi:hypothetical protein